MTTLIDDIKADRGVARGNRWTLLETLSSVTVMDGATQVLAYHYRPSEPNRANARRIARVPTLEDAYIAAVEENDRLRVALNAARENLHEIEAGDMSAFEAIDAIALVIGEAQ